MFRYQIDKDTLIVYLHGELDHYAAEKQRSAIDRLICQSEISLLILDFSGVDFMDSSGVGMIIGRYKTMISRGGCIRACGLHPPVDRLFHIAGLHRIIETQKEERREHA